MNLEKDDKQAKQDLSGDMKEVLEEMKEEGKLPDPKKEDQKPTEPEKKEEEGKEPSTKEEGSNKEKEPEPKQERKPAIPIPKFRQYRNKWKAKEEELSGELEDKNSQIKELTEELEKVRTPQAFQSKMKEFSEKHGLDEEAMTDLGKLIVAEAAQHSKSFEKRLQEYDDILQETQDEKMFEEEFERESVEEPDMKDHKDKIREMALHDPEWVDKSLYEIFHRGIEPNLAPLKKKTAEKSRGGSQKGEVIDFANLSKEEIHAMGDKEFDAYQKWLRGQSGSILRRSK